MSNGEALLAAPLCRFRWRGHTIGYRVAGSGAPLVLVHSINAAASMFEMRRPFAALQATRRVYAFDLLGFGDSDRPAQVYDAALYQALITDFVAEVVGSAADVLASSLGAAYTAAAAAASPALFRRLVLVCPTGLRDLVMPATPGSAYAVLRGPVGEALFRALASRASIAWFLRGQTYADPACVDEATIDGFVRAARHPGARFAPICFLTGLLNCDLRQRFARIEAPILLIWGREAVNTPVERAAEFVALRPATSLVVIERAGMLVQDEQPAPLLAAVQPFFDAG